MTRNDSDKVLGSLELRQVAAATAVIIGMCVLATLLYRLIDIFFLLFVGIVISAALHPWHAKLSAWGIPKALAVLLLYLAFFVGLVSIVLLIGPSLIDQVGAVASDLPKNYSSVRATLRASEIAPVRLLGARLPPFERLTNTLTGAAPEFSLIGATTSVAEVLAYVVSVLAVALYWTLEVGRFERLIVSMMPVERRARALNIWHEIESKLGGFVRGQGLAMLAIGVASGIGYALIGLPNALALAVLAGLLEAVPLLGPVLGAIPAVLVALPFGINTTLLVVALATTLQLLENYVLIPRIMHETVGVSALVNILAVLSFGSLYGFAGVFIAIPMAATIQVLLESFVIEPPVEENHRRAEDPLATLRGRLAVLRQRLRDRLRSRESRMGIDPAEAEHVIDAVDQRIEQGVSRIEESIAEAEAASEGMPAQARAALRERLEAATAKIEQTIDLVDPIVAAANEAPEPDARWSAASLDELSRAAGQVGEIVERIEADLAAMAATRFTTEPSP